jgi:hypothetical protein
MTAEAPTMAIEHVFVVNNTSIIQVRAAPRPLPAWSRRAATPDAWLPLHECRTRCWRTGSASCPFWSTHSCLCTRLVCPPRPARARSAAQLRAALGDHLAAPWRPRCRERMTRSASATPLCSS